jgi:hypothetical protein
MPGDLRRRVERLECATGVSGDILPRIFIPPPECADVPAWERACMAEAARDGVRPLIVRFVKPGDVPPGGIVH